MSLSKDNLLDNIWDVIQRAGSGSIDIDPNIFPNMPEPLARAFAEAYDQYAADATANADQGTLTVVTKGSIDQLKQNMMQPNLSGWAAGVGVYWGTAVFGGVPFYVDNNQVTTESGTKTIQSISDDIKVFLDLSVNPPQKASEGADRLATLLHKGTALLIIKTTTSDSSGTLGTAPIS